MLPNRGFMDAAHVHLALNHFPVIGAIIAILLLGYALLKRSDELTRAGLALLFLVGTVAIPVFITGEPAEQLSSIYRVSRNNLLDNMKAMRITHSESQS